MSGKNNPSFGKPSTIKGKKIFDLMVNKNGYDKAKIILERSVKARKETLKLKKFSYRGKNNGMYAKNYFKSI
jgi:hypothetical protein